MQKIVNKNISQNRYQELDALRGIAALMVVLFHYTMGKPQARFGFSIGITGVDLFFMISGFVIFMSLNKIKNSKDFIINRASRLYPTYWSCVSFTFIIMSLISFHRNEHIDLIQYIGNMTMFQYYMGIKDLDGPYWTMIIEMIFYGLILLIFHFKLTNYLNWIFVIIIILIVSSTSFFHVNFFFNLLNQIPLLQYISLFFAGIIFYKIYDNTNSVSYYLILFLCLICQILMYNYSGRAISYVSHLQYTLILCFYFLLFTLFVNGKLKFIISLPTLFLGKISFALYLIHQYVSIYVIIPTLINRFHINFWIASIFISLPIVIGLATVITYYIEIPIRLKMKQKLQLIHFYLYQ